MGAGDALPGRSRPGRHRQGPQHAARSVVARPAYRHQGRLRPDLAVRLRQPARGVGAGAAALCRQAVRLAAGRARRRSEIVRGADGRHRLPRRPRGGARAGSPAQGPGPAARRSRPLPARGRARCRGGQAFADAALSKTQREPSMSARHAPPFRAEHVGSFIRPPELVQARQAFGAGRLSAAELSAVEDRAIRDVVAMQEEVGLPVVTDGEFRRQFWNTDFFMRIGGVSERPGAFVANFRNESGAVPVKRNDLHVTGRLQLRETIFGDHFRYLASVTRTATPKLSIPSPSLLHRRGGTAVLDGTVYSSLEQFLDDLVAVYRDEIAALGRLGCTYLQLDDTSFAALCDPAMREALTKAGSDGERIHLTYIKLINDSIRSRPAGMSVCMHTCRGNYRGAWLSTGSYDFIAEAMFNGLEIDGFLLEYDDERSGGFEPLRFVPRGKLVVLGLVTTKNGALENKDALKRRIELAAKYVPLEQLCLSPQCGFSCAVQSEALTPAEQQAKLRLIVETAREVWR